MTADVIIVGAGFSGAACAWMLAEKGHHVRLFEARPPESLGQGYHRVMLDVDTFSKSGLARPSGEELLSLLDQFYAYSPSGQVRKAIDFSALLLNGVAFQQRLVRDAQQAGAQLETRRVAGPLLRDGQVVGVRDAEGEEHEAALVIDASGNAQVLVQALAHQGLIPELPLSELHSAYGVAYRQTCRTNAADNSLHIHFCVTGGYVWRSAFDIGLGMMSPSEIDLGALQREVARVSEQFGWETEALESEDMGKIPVRYPLLGLVADGFAVLGDAAFMVNSVRGGGISAGLKGARVLSEVADVALRERDLRHERLWDYSQRYQQQFGAQLAYQDVMRQILMNESADNMEFAFEKDIITADDIKGSLAGRLLDFSTLQKIQKGLRGAANPALLLRFNQRLEWGKQLYDHFRHYPANPALFAAWQADTLKLLERIAA
ncbi:MAG: NAD(P)/FAD-dependent oxidoreductase [Candidatus Sericytochromatia bacterium]